VAALLSSLDEEAAEFRPSRFDLSNEDDRGALSALLSGPRPPRTKCDQVGSQVRELLRSRTPTLSSAELDDAAHGFIEEHGQETYGRWVYYPWRGTLVRVLAEPDFVELRTSRNRYKITAQEQERLAHATIGVAGLSAGYTMAVCLALERIGARFRLADFDPMALSNMNRVPCGLAGIGSNKAVLAARALYEIDPYLDVMAFTDGVTDANLTAFFDSNGARLDVLVEECDDLYMKVRLREEARARGIPVVMETNDRGLLDVERFDLEPSRPVFHGLLEGARSEELRRLDVEGKTPFVVRILGEGISPRLAVSLMETERTVAGWSQLASGVMLGAAVVTDVARRILLGQLRASGRTTVDLDEIVTGSSLEMLRVESPPAAPSTKLVEQVRPPIAARSANPSRAEMEWLVRHACMAPSGGNEQPWRFVGRRARELEGYLDRDRSGSFLDFERSASYLALGAALENAQIAATGLGRSQKVSLFPVPSEPDLVWRLSLGEPASGVAESPLLPFVALRATNRRLADRRPLDPRHAHALGEAARERGAELTLVTDPSKLVALGVLLGEVDRFRFLCERLRTAMMSELRWTPEAVSGTGDGIDVATLELDTMAMAGLRLLSNPETAALLRSLDLGGRLKTPARRSIAAASAVGLLSIEGVDSRAHVQAGRAIQSVWLTGTRLGLAFQPMSAAPYLFARLVRGAGEGFTSRECARLGELREAFAAIFPSKPGRAETMLFRLAHAPEPTARALRRPLHAVFTEA
jgi:hypothetical protein